MSKVGIYSGTFDPIHDGHVAFANKTIEIMGLDILYVLPEETSWRKKGVTNIKHRQAMVDIAFSGCNNIATKLDGMSKQHDVASSLRVFAQEHPNDQIVLLMGVDVFLNIDNWHGYQELIDNCEFAIALRTEDDGEELVYKLQQLPQAEVTKIVTENSTLTSSKIRQTLSKGQTPTGLHPKVLQYIQDNSLYQSS